MTDKPSNYSRRTLLKLTETALTTTALAGCTDTTDLETNTDATVDTGIETSEPTTDTTDTNDSAYTDETIETAQTVRESTVKIETGNGDGTGWVLDTENAYIVTNSHVVSDHDEVQVTTYDDTTYTGTRVS